MIIRLKVFEQTLSIVDTKSVPRKGSKDYLVLHFLFSSDWKDLNKICYLQHGEVSQPIDVVDGLVEVPEWFTQQDSFDVTLFGKGGSQEVPTNVVSLRLEKSNSLWEQDAPEPQPSWLAKVIDLNNHPPVPGENGYWLIWDTYSGAYVESEFPLPAGGSGGTSDHSKLINRDNADQHPMSAVTGLVEALNGKQPAGDYLTQDNLQSATDAALAQAKASGEFDGTDGTTPHIGDNGNWYLGDTDTGKPSRGANGKDGAGMDITGATVGQIAKITAVDDSGKPTAWEAVDMPSGGGSGGKQLLYRHNISQDTVLTTDSFDTSGANIDLSVYSHLYIRGMFICNSPTETYGFFYLNGTKFVQIQYFNRKIGQTIGFEADIVCLKTQNKSSAGLLSFVWCSGFNLQKFDNIYVESGSSKSRVNDNLQSIGFSAVESADIFAVKAGSYVEVWGD